MFRFNPSSHLQPKQERHEDPAQGDMINGISNPQYLHISESNPLFAQDRTIFGAYNSTGPAQSHSSLNLEPMNHNVAHGQITSNDQQDHNTAGRSIKMESHFNDMINNVAAGECKQNSFAENEVWATTETLDL